MPRYVVQRTFPDGLHIPVGNGGADICLAVVERNADEGVTWIHSYVSEDKRRRSASTTGPTPRRSERRRPATSSRSTGSPRSPCSTPTSTSEESPMPHNVRLDSLNAERPALPATHHGARGPGHPPPSRRRPRRRKTTATPQ